MRRAPVLAALSGCCLLLLLASVTRADPPGVSTNREGAKTLPLPKGDDVFHFVVYGDRTGGPAVGIRVLERAVRETNLLAPDLVMTVGDLVQGYCGQAKWITQMEEFHGVMGALQMPWYPVAGNHDVYWRGGTKPEGQHERNFETHFGPLWYSFRHKNAAFIVLYTDEGDPLSNRKGWRDAQVNQMSKAQLAWLDTTLTHTKDADHVFVFLHHPRWRADYYKGTNWEHAHGLLKQAGNVSAVFAGHMHRRRYHGARDGIEYYTLAAVGGSMPFNIPGTGHLHHMDVVTVRKRGFKVATIPVGSVLDPKEMTPERIQEIDTLRRLPLRALGAPIVVTSTGTAAAQIGLKIENPTSRPLDVQVRVDAPDRGWRFQVDHLHAQIEPHKAHTFAFACYRRQGEGLARLGVPRLLVDMGYLGQTLRVDLPERSVPLNLLVGALPVSFWKDAPDQALVLAKRDTCVGIPAAKIEVPDGPFTLEGWLKADSFKGRRGFISKAELSEYGLFVSNGQPHFTVFLGDAYVSAEGKQGTLKAGSWIHLAGVYDGSEVRLYVDGRLISAVTGTGKRRRNRLPLLIGADVTMRGKAMSGLTGQIDEVRLSTGARYTGASFAPARRFALDPDTLLLLHFDRGFGPFTPDASSAARHAVARGKVTYAPVGAAPK